MREVFVHQDHTRVALYKTLLDEVGIPSFMRNEYSNNGVTEMPSPIFFPALCVVNDEDYERARRVLFETPRSQSPDWRCPKCNEQVPGTFDSCWNCAVLRPDGSIEGSA